MTEKMKIEFTYRIGEAGGSMLAHAYAQELEKRGAKVTLIDDLMGEQSLFARAIDCMDCSHLEVEVIKHVKHPPKPKVRPFNSDEAWKYLRPGRELWHKQTKEFHVIEMFCETAKNGWAILINDGYVAANSVLKQYEYPKGEPCGVPE